MRRWGDEEMRRWRERFLSIHFHSVSLSHSVTNHPDYTALPLVCPPLLSLRAGGEIQFTYSRAKPHNQCTIMRIIYRLPITIQKKKLAGCKIQYQKILIIKFSKSEAFPWCSMPIWPYCIKPKPNKSIELFRETKCDFRMILHFNWLRKNGNIWGSNLAPQKIALEEDDIYHMFSQSKA